MKLVSHATAKSPRGQILGDKVGMLKLLFHQDSRQILGCSRDRPRRHGAHPHRANRHGLQRTIDYFIENTFNYPTLAECYRVAGLNGYNKITAGRLTRGKA